jgi:ATP-dependent protease ClpP protease subunit
MLLRALLLAALTSSVDISLPPPSNANDLQLVGEITKDEADVFVARLAGANPDREILVHLNTPGGDLSAALVIAQALESTSQRGGHIRCLVDGHAASAGLYVLESCPRREMTARSLLMAHEPWMPINGPVDLTVAALIHDRLVADRLLYASQCVARMRISLADFLKRIDGREWWLGPAEALELGAVDAVVPSPNARL